MSDLTVKERHFVRFYTGKLPWTPIGNATAAARQAGYRWPEKQGWQVVTRPRVRHAIEHGLPPWKGRRREPMPPPMVVSFGC